MQNQNLYESLTRFPLEPSFSKRLRRENRWSTTYTARAMAEYKRFVYLAAVSPNPVTPSEVVDKVWHLHLVYTRSYWQDLCAGLLGRPLHHDPSAGGGSEATKFVNWYEATKALYRQEFGEEPASDLWPATADWILPQSSWWRRLRSIEVFPVVLPVLGIWAGNWVLPFVVAAFVLAVVVRVVTGQFTDEGDDRKKRKAAADCDISGLDVGSSSSECGESGGGDCGDGGGGCGGGD